MYRVILLVACLSMPLAALLAPQSPQGQSPRNTQGGPYAEQGAPRSPQGSPHGRSSRPRQGNSLATRNVLSQSVNEDYNRLYSTVQDLQEAVVLLQEQNRKLHQKMFRIEEKLTDQELKMITAASLEEWSGKFTAELEKIDARRIEDNRKLLDQLKLMAEQLASMPAQVAPLVVEESAVEAPSAAIEEDPPSLGPVFEVTIQKGYTLAGIAKTYREQGHPVTVKEILAINPGINPRSLRIGQVISIPAKE